jgi:hypothetical protein
MQLPAFHPRRVAGTLCLALACAALAAPAHAQWKWRDSRGQIHVSDTPPPRDVPDKDVLQRPAPGARKAAPAGSAAAPSAPASAASGAAAARPTVDKELEQRKRQAEQEQAAKQKAEERKNADKRAENCRSAREQLALMESGMRVVRVRSDGERYYLTDDQRAAEAHRARDAIATDCR